MSKHTPGPWYAKGCGIYCGELGEYLLAATGDDEGHFSAEAQQANAHLIAAAPEMLEALKEAHPFITDDTIRILVGAAIAKAEGRE